MARPTPLAALGMDAQVAIRDCRKACAPLYEAALASGDFDVMMEMQALAGSLRIASTQARRLTGYADRVACPDGRIGLWHGRAA